MLFASIEFYLFLVAVFTVWLLTPAVKRPIILLTAGYLFYMAWQPWFALVLIFCTGITWQAGLYLEQIPDLNFKKRVLAGAVVLNLLPLLFFKYFNFICTSLEPVFSLSGWIFPVFHLDILLPVGISFYTFQAISYCADIYNGKLRAEPDLFIFALYLSFFPKLISGPIERGASLLPQIKRSGMFNGPLFVSGVRLFIWGVFKKIVIADRMGMYVDLVFSDPQTMFGKTAVIGMWMFSLQIYCDFSAYMDMAVGCGRMFGIELSRNFNFPYMTRSVADFWRCWHITLTSWFRDYVYIPLGGNKSSTGRWAVNIMVVFLLSGLWHGAAWTFVFWGALHGIFYLADRLSEALRGRIRELLGIRGKALALWQVFWTFQLVSLAWVFFRADTIDDAFILIRNMFMHPDLPLRMLSSQFSTALAFGFALVFVGIELVHFLAVKKGIDPVRYLPVIIRYPVYAAGLLIIALFGVSTHNFIYFQF